MRYKQTFQGLYGLVLSLCVHLNAHGSTNNLSSSFTEDEQRLALTPAFVESVFSKAEGVFDKESVWKLAQKGYEPAIRYAGSRYFGSSNEWVETVLDNPDKYTPTLYVEQLDRKLAGFLFGSFGYQMNLEQLQIFIEGMLVAPVTEIIPQAKDVLLEYQIRLYERMVARDARLKPALTQWCRDQLEPGRLVSAMVRRKALDALDERLIPQYKDHLDPAVRNHMVSLLYSQLADAKDWDFDKHTALYKQFQNDPGANVALSAAVYYLIYLTLPKHKTVKFYARIRDLLQQASQNSHGCVRQWGKEQQCLRMAFGYDGYSVDKGAAHVLALNAIDEMVTRSDPFDLSASLRKCVGIFEECAGSPATEQTKLMLVQFLNLKPHDPAYGPVRRWAYEQIFYYLQVGEAGYPKSAQKALEWLEAGCKHADSAIRTWCQETKLRSRVLGLNGYPENLGLRHQFLVNLINPPAFPEQSSGADDVAAPDHHVLGG